MWRKNRRAREDARHDLLLRPDGINVWPLGSSVACLRFKTSNRRRKNFFVLPEFRSKAILFALHVSVHKWRKVGIFHFFGFFVGPGVDYSRRCSWSVTWCHLAVSESKVGVEAVGADGIMHEGLDRLITMVCFEEAVNGGARLKSLIAIEDDRVTGWVFPFLEHCEVGVVEFVAVLADFGHLGNNACGRFGPGAVGRDDVGRWWGLGALNLLAAEGAIAFEFRLLLSMLFLFIQGLGLHLLLAAAKF